MMWPQVSKINVNYLELTYENFLIFYEQLFGDEFQKV